MDGLYYKVDYKNPSALADEGWICETQVCANYRLMDEATSSEVADVAAHNHCCKSAGKLVREHWHRVFAPVKAAKPIARYYAHRLAPDGCVKNQQRWRTETLLHMFAESTAKSPAIQLPAFIQLKTFAVRTSVTSTG